MSRAATALDYQYARAAEQATHRQHRTSTIRLLGDADGMTYDRPAPAKHAPRVMQVTRRPHSVPARAPAYQVWVWHPATVSTERLKVSTRPWGIAHPQWLIATLACIVALLAVSPVFAGGRAAVGSKRPLLNSGGKASGQSKEPRPAEAAANTPKSAPAASQDTSRKYELLGPPSISVKQVESVLQEYSSPAVGHGQSLFDLGVRYGIDPAYALAFFVHESGCGTRGVARFSHSLGNIRWTPGFDNYEGYRSYPSWEAGMEDWYVLITDLYIGGWNLRTVDEIVPVYAPYGDNNNPPAYISAVKSMVDSWRGK